MKIIDYLKSTARLTTAIFLSLVGLAVLVALCTAAYFSWEKSKVKEFETTRSFSVDLRTNLQFSLFAATKLVDSKLFMRINTDAYPSYLSDPRLALKNAGESIIVNFVDKDSFKVFSKTIPLNRFSTNVDAEGKRIGLSFEDEDILPAKTYASIDRITVQWTLDTTIPVTPVIPSTPKPSAVAKPALASDSDPDDTVLDHCAPGITKEERLKRLSHYGAVRQTGMGRYSVGFRSLAFFTSNNTLLSCQ